MVISEVIEALEAQLRLHGDIKCFTNGEYGAEDLVELTADTISSGLAENELGDTKTRFAGTNVLTIGGY